MPKPSLILQQVGEEVRPCDGCPKRKKCAALHLACGDFSVWLNTGDVETGNRKPTAKRYDALYPGH